MTAVSHRVPDTVRGVHRYTVYLRCDGRGCDKKINGYASVTRSIARSEGWQVGPPKDYCPEHRTDK